MAYRVQKVSDLFFVQHFRKGEWLFTTGPVGCNGSRGFSSYLEAYNWIVQNKLHGNYAVAALKIR